jgi:hypothetical protein
MGNIELKAADGFECCSRDFLECSPKTETTVQKFEPSNLQRPAQPQISAADQNDNDEELELPLHLVARNMKGSPRTVKVQVHNDKRIFRAIALNARRRLCFIMQLVRVIFAPCRSITIL